MLVTDPADYRIGDIIMFDGSGPTFKALSWLLGRFDKNWRNMKRKPWHVGFLYDYVDDWWIGQAAGKQGVCLSKLKDFEEPYLVFRWFDEPPSGLALAFFMTIHNGEKYDTFWGYAFTIISYFVSWFPRIIDRKWMCWEFLALFMSKFGKPLDEEWVYPFITFMMTKFGYPGWESAKVE
jgi:hypothetical protein